MWGCSPPHFLGSCSDPYTSQMGMDQKWKPPPTKIELHKLARICGRFKPLNFDPCRMYCPPMPGAFPRMSARGIQSTAAQPASSRYADSPWRGSSNGLKVAKRLKLQMTGTPTFSINLVGGLAQVGIDFSNTSHQVIKRLGPSHNERFVTRYSVWSLRFVSSEFLVEFLVRWSSWSPVIEALCCHLVSCLFCWCGTVEIEGTSACSTCKSCTQKRFAYCKCLSTILRACELDVQPETHTGPRFKKIPDDPNETTQISKAISTLKRYHCLKLFPTHYL